MPETDKDLADITEYYFDELGKIQDLRPDVPSLTKKEAKSLKKQVFKLFLADLLNLKAFKNAENMIKSNEIKKSRENYIESQKQQKLPKPSLFKRLLSTFKRGPEIMIENNAPQALGQGLSEEEPKEEVIEGEESPKEQENGQSNPVSQPQTSQEVNGTGERTGQPQ